MKNINWMDIIPRSVTELIFRLNSHDYEAWLVGGCVRDMVLGIKPSDYDVATNANPDQIHDLFDHCLDTGIRHGTVTVIMSDLHIEVTTFRSEGPYSDGRRPDHIKYESELLPDLARRDFTINSMAWHPKKGLRDPFNGIGDLQHQILRCVGSPKERIMEDALRQLRAVRFALTYDLKPEQNLLIAIKENYSAISKLSSERVLAELMRLIRAPYAHAVNYFSGTHLMAEVVKKTLDMSIDDKALCKSLSCFIQPFWNKGQIWPVLYCASLMAKINAQPSDTQSNDLPDSFLIEDWYKIALSLSVYKLTELPVQLVRRTRLSQTMARQSHAILIMIGMKLLFEKSCRTAYGKKNTFDRFQQEKILRIIIRNTGRVSKLKYELILPLVGLSWSVLRSLAADDLLRKSIDDDLKMIRTWHSFPMESISSLEQLPIRGDHIIFAQLKDKSNIGILLERLLSFCILNNNIPTEDEAVNMIRNWTFNETVNERNLSY